MLKERRLPVKRAIFLACATVFLVLTWTFGGQSGYSSGIGNTLLWFTAIFVSIYEGFERFLIDESQRSDMKFAAAISLIFVFALIPISWYSIGDLAPSAILGPASVLAYVVYGLCLAYKNPERKTASKSRLQKIQTFHIGVGLDFLAFCISVIHLFAPFISMPAASAGVFPFNPS